MNTPARGETAPPAQARLLTVETQPVAPRVPPRGASPTKLFRAWSPEQAALVPAAKRDHLGEGPLAVFLLDLLPTLTLQPILHAYAEDRGQPPYDPRMMTVLLLYAYSQGITSSRQIERRCREDLGFMYLTADACPDHDTICAFRREHLPAFQGLFLETGSAGRGSNRLGAYPRSRNPPLVPSGRSSRSFLRHAPRDGSGSPPGSARRS